MVWHNPNTKLFFPNSCSSWMFSEFFFINFISQTFSLQLTPPYFLESLFPSCLLCFIFCFLLFIILIQTSSGSRFFVCFQTYLFLCFRTNSFVATQLCVVRITQTLEIHYIIVQHNASSPGSSSSWNYPVIPSSPSHVPLFLPPSLSHNRSQPNRSVNTSFCKIYGSASL